MQHNFVRYFGFTLLMLTGLAMSGCEEEGPAERMGERLDDAISDTQERLEDVRDEAEETAEEIGDALRRE